MPAMLVSGALFHIDKVWNLKSDNWYTGKAPKRYI